MIKPSLPKNETLRNECVQNLNILDTQPEERFDRVTRLARRLFDVPIALITLIESDRQWFKSVNGLDTTETSRDTSFCGHAILQNQIMLVEDATQDKRFFDNPYVLDDPQVRFYAGCPLQIDNQYNVGTLCLIDKKPRQVDDEFLKNLRDLADMVQMELQFFQLSITDELTKISNRRGFLKIAQHTLNMCKRYDKTATLFFFDLDKFKQINDTYGHEAGDKMLTFFSNSLVETFRESDVIARLGGDEFCVLCSNFDSEKINNLLNRLDKILKNNEEKCHNIQYSVGQAVYNSEKHLTIADLLAESDRRMYINKNS